MSSYNELGIELMVTGANAGTWGDKTNTNLNIIQQAIAGYLSQAVTDGGTLALAITDGSTSTSKARNMILKLTGTLGGNSIVTVPDSVEKMFVVEDGCDHAGNTLTFKTVSGTGLLLCEGNTVTCFSDGTNIVKANEFRKWRTITASETVQSGANLFVDTNGGAVTVTLPASPADGDIVNFVDSRYTFDANALTVGRNSLKIANASSDLTVNTEGAAFGLVYSGSNVGWTYTEK